MAKLSDIAKVTIELRTASIAKANFGIPMIAAVSDVLKNRAEIFYDYNSALEYKGIGDTTLEQPILDAIRAAFSQTPRADRLVVGKLDADANAVATLVASVAPGGKLAKDVSLDLTIDGVDVTYKTLADDEPVATALAGVLTAIGASSVKDKYTVTSDDVAGTITFAPKTGSHAVLTPSTTFTVKAAGDLTKPLETQLNEIQGFTPWYGFALVGFSGDQNDTLVTEAAAYAEAAEPSVQFFAASTDDTIPQPGESDTLSMLAKRKYLRTMMIPTKNTDMLEPVAAMSRFYVGEPGKIIAGLKTLVGILPTAWSPLETTTIWGKNGNTYEKYAADTYLLNPGKAVGGEWFDVVRDRDWLIDDIQKSLASAMIRNPKIPYTNEGITILFNILQGRLRNAQKQGVIAPDQKNSLGQTVPGFIITVPNAADLDADTRASRKLQMSFVALLAGAIQMVDVQGVLSYTYEG